MSTLTVEFNNIKYILFNLTPELICDIRNDRAKLLQYFTICRDARTNICILEDCENSPSFLENMQSSNDVCSDVLNTPSTSATSANVEKHQKFEFLCGSFAKQGFIYGVKFGDYAWHYFDELDSIRSEHSSLPRSIDTAISRMSADAVVAVTLSFDNVQAGLYFQDGQFVFKNKELKTYLTFAGEINERTTKPKRNKKMVFIPGQTNPLLFLKDIEKMNHLNEKDKMHEILQFVKDCDKGEFTELYFTSNWQTIKSKFLTAYTLPFLQNKKKELNVDFEGEINLRSFVEAKLNALTKYTTLPFFNQVEMVMSDLPVEIAKQFIVNEKMAGTKDEILSYCETIQNMAEHYLKKSKPPPTEIHVDSNDPPETLEMEIFEFNESTPPYRGGKRGRSRGVRKGITSTRRRPGPLRRIAEDNESDESYSFIEQMDDTSRSSFSEG